MSTSPHAAAPSLGDRREGFLVGAVLGASLAAGTAGLTDPDAIRARLDGTGLPAPRGAPDGRRPAATALGDALLQQLIAGGVDLRRLAQGWVAWWREDGLDADPVLVEALRHLHDYDAPVEALPAHGVAPLAAALPAALASASPQSMIGGAFHVARLLDPSEEAALATVAVVVAASCFLEGRRDFLADVVAALRANDAPLALLEALRTIPRDPRTAPPLPRGATPDPVAATTWLLWIAHHRPRGVDELAAMALAGDVAPTLGAVLGALVGARDAITTWPAAWITANEEEVRLRAVLARRLGGAAHG